MYEWKTAQNAIYLDDEVAGKGRQFKCRFLVPGLVKYDFGVCLLTKENADRFIQGFVGCPVIINHQELNDKNAKEQSVGNIFSVWFDDKDGYYWCNGIITDKHAIELIDKGYSVSCQYTITDYSDNTSGALHNGNSYDKLIEDGKPEHLAIVNNPRYEGAIIAVNAILAQNEDKWITIHPNGEENKGRHLLLKDGESVEDAMHRNGWYEKRQAKEDNKEENFEKETKSTKKDENRHQKILDLEDKAYKEFKKTYDNYIQGDVKISDFGKAKEQFNKKYKDAFDKLESDRFVSFEDFAKRENKQSGKEEKGEPKKYTYTLTKKEVGNDAWLGGMADTGNYYTNGSFAIDKRYLDIKGQEPKKVPDIDNNVKKILTETAKQKQKEDKYTSVKDFEVGELKKEGGKPIPVAKYSYYDEKNGYTRNIYVNKKYNDLFKNFELKFGSEVSPIYAYDKGELVGTVMPIMVRDSSYSASNSFIEQFKDTLYTALAEGIVKRLGELIASNEDKWITIHPHGKESDDYRRLKIKEGETVEDAMHRQGYYNKRQAKDEKKQKEEKLNNQNNFKNKVTSIQNEIKDLDNKTEEIEKKLSVHRRNIYQMYEDSFTREEADKKKEKYLQENSEELDKLAEEEDKISKERTIKQKELDTILEKEVEEVLNIELEGLDKDSIDNLIKRSKELFMMPILYPLQLKLQQKIFDINEKASGLKYQSTRKEVKEVAGVKKGKPMTFKEADSGKVNPNFGNNTSGLSYSKNCQSCVVCYQLRRNGFNVQVKGIPIDAEGNIIQSGKMYELARHPEKAWIDPKTGFPPELNICDATTPQKAYNWLNDNVKDGTYSFRVVWKGGKKPSGHIVIAHKENGNLKVYDPQTNKEYNSQEEITSEFFDSCRLKTKVKEYKPFIYRTDNLDVNKDYADAIMEKP